MILITGGLGFIGLHTARSFLDAGESYPYIGVIRGYNPDPVFLQEPKPKCFGIYIIELEAHEIAGIERVGCPYMGKSFLRENFLHRCGPGS